MTAAIYNSNWGALGGGERYSAAVAVCLEKLGYKVEIWWPRDIRDAITNRFHITLSDQVVFTNYSPQSDTLTKRLKKFRHYDLIFWVSDGSIPLSFAKKTLIHFQIPFHSPQCGTLLNKLKAQFYICVCNSNFTKQFIDPTYSIKSQVLYPPVATSLFTPAKKLNQIVSVARFSQVLHAKRQDILIQAFEKLHKALPDWKLVLAGGSLDPDYVTLLQRKTAHLPVQITVDPDFSQVKTLLEQSKIFWSATGFAIDQTLHPEKIEHFGITVVEAMAAGCVPVVTPLGGHTETVTSVSGLFWESEDELVNQTLALARSPEKLRSMSNEAILWSKQFDQATFSNHLTRLIL